MENLERIHISNIVMSQKSVESVAEKRTADGGEMPPTTDALSQLRSPPDETGATDSANVAPEPILVDDEAKENEVTTEVGPTKECVDTTQSPAVQLSQIVAETTEVAEELEAHINSSSSENSSEGSDGNIRERGKGDSWDTLVKEDVDWKLSLAEGNYTITPPLDTHVPTMSPDYGVVQTTPPDLTKFGDTPIDTNSRDDSRKLLVDDLKPGAELVVITRSEKEDVMFPCALRGHYVSIVIYYNSLS